MSFNITLPNITAASERGQLEQIRSYLYQLTEQLKWALNSIEQGSKSTNEMPVKERQDTYNSIKSFIIRSADIRGDARVGKTLYPNHIASIDSYASKDFNELVYKTGYYSGTSAPSSVSSVNYPINETGVLEVISCMEQNAETLDWWGFAYQTYRTHTGIMYIRSYFSTTGWTTWKKVTLT